MSEDIVARLRNEHCKFSAVRGGNKLELPWRTVPRLALLWGEAADEIERLRAELRTYTGDGHNTKGEPCTPNTPS